MLVHLSFWITTYINYYSIIINLIFNLIQVLSEAQSLLNSNFHNRKSAPYFGPMDGIVQYMDDRLVVVAEASTSDTRELIIESNHRIFHSFNSVSLSQIDPQQLPMSPYTPSITARRYSSRLLPEPLDSTVQQQSRPTGNQNDDGGRELNGDQNEEREQSLTLMSESSSPETVSTPSLRIDSISTTMSLRNPINIHHVDVRNGTVVHYGSRIRLMIIIVLIPPPLFFSLFPSI